MTFIINIITSFMARSLPVLRVVVLNPRVIMVALAGALAVAVMVEETRLTSARRQAVVAALEMSNLAAQRDSTRDAAATNQSVARVLGDSLKLVEKRVVQMAQRGDALDKALGRERVARYVGDVAVDSLQRAVYASNTGALADQNVRSAFFNIRQEPYTVAAQVDIPAPPDSAHLELHVAIDPIPIEARVSCSRPDEHGIKTAAVSASSPPWATVRFGRVEQSADVCGSPALKAIAQSRRGLIRSKLMIGAGRALTAGGWRWAVFAGAGIGLEL